jgi:hypothetical protein
VRRFFAGVFSFALTLGLLLPVSARADGGDVNSPDLEVLGFTVFGTNTAGATSVTSGWGTVYIDDSLEVHSNLTVNGRIDSSDLIQMNRYGLTQGAQLLTGLTAIQPTASYIRVQGDGGNIDMQANPQIAAGEPGQLLTLQGTANDRMVRIEDGAGVQTQMDQPFSLGLYDTLQLIFDPVTTNWVEINRSNNRSSN